MAAGSWNNVFATLLEYTRAKASQINERVNGLSSNWDKLPLPRDDAERGFNDPCAVGDGVQNFQATSVSQVRGNLLRYSEDTGEDLGGIVRDHVLNLPVAPDAYTAGLKVSFTAVGASDGVANTINVNGLGAIPLVNAVGEEIAAGAITINDIVECVYVNGKFWLTLPVDSTTGRGEMPTGGNGDEVFYENSQIVENDYTLTPGKNALSAGPITVNPGVTVTVPAGANWVVV